jgi:hypothetical protein
MPLQTSPLLRGWRELPSGVAGPERAWQNQTEISTFENLVFQATKILLLHEEECTSNPNFAKDKKPRRGSGVPFQRAPLERSG